MINDIAGNDDALLGIDKSVTGCSMSGPSIRGNFE